MEKKKFSLVIRLFVVLFIIGILFKIQHWPFYNWLVLLGMLGVGLFYFLRFKAKNKKSKLDYAKLLFIEFWVVRGLFLYFHWPFSNEIDFLAWMFSVYWIIQEGFAFARREADSGVQRDKSLLILLLLAFLGITFGTICSIMHFPYPMVFIGIGLLSGFLWYLKSYSKA